MENIIIEQETMYGKIEIFLDSYDILLQQVASNNRLQMVFIDRLNAQIVAKSICPNYQKVIDQNTKLFEALECLYNAIPNDGSYNYQSAMDNAYRIMQNHKKC